jgi:hypothetical protein
MIPILLGLSHGGQSSSSTYRIRTYCPPPRFPLPSCASCSSARLGMALVPNISGRCETFASLPHCVPKPLVAKLVDHARAGIDKLVDLGRGREWLST